MNIVIGRPRMNILIYSPSVETKKRVNHVASLHKEWAQKKPGISTEVQITLVIQQLFLKPELGKGPDFIF